MDIAEKLIDAGAYVNIKNKYGDTAYSLATKGGFKALRLLLVKKGAEEIREII
jgi:ankyrin repeat protein